jgi:hypothetical protein
MFGAGKEYDFLMHYNTTQTSDGGGGLLGSITINPAVTSFAEWSALSSLFDECKGISSRIEFLTNLMVTTVLGDMVMAFDETRVASSAPASYLSILRLAESKSWVMALANGGSGRHSQTRKLVSRPWAITATPAPTAPLAGLAGGWSFGNSGLFPVSTAVATVNLMVHVRLRCRG